MNIIDQNVFLIKEKILFRIINMKLKKNSNRKYKNYNNHDLYKNLQIINIQNSKIINIYIKTNQKYKFIILMKMNR
jgi:hypothetical protein